MSAQVLDLDPRVQARRELLEDKIRDHKAAIIRARRTEAWETAELAKVQAELAALCGGRQG